MGPIKLYQLIVILGMTPAAMTCCSHYRMDGRREAIEAKGNQMWGVGLEKSSHQERIHSVTRLNGGRSVTEKMSAVVASGSTGNWQWEVRSVPSVLQSWKAWQQNKTVQQRAEEPDQWSHPAATWDQAFTRAYQTSSYLLGRPLLPLKLTLLLVPEDSNYKKTAVEARSNYIPLIFAFYFPSGAADSDELRVKRFSAMVEAVTTTVYEYQHILVDTEMIQPMGNGEADKTINDEARSQCWSDSVYLALTSGTHTESRWDPLKARKSLMLAGSHGTVSPVSRKASEDNEPPMQYADAWLWGKYLEAKSMFSYLQMRNIRDAKVLSNEPEGMDAVMSVCRALTQHPRDLTTGEIRSSEIEYAPFFSPLLGSHASNGSRQ